MTNPDGLCPSIGYLIVGGKQVGLLKCQLIADHSVEKHAATLEWFDDAGIDWPEAYDKAETYDTDVPLDLPPDFGEDTEPMPELEERHPGPVDPDA